LKFAVGDISNIIPVPAALTTLFVTVPFTTVIFPGENPVDRGSLEITSIVYVLPENVNPASTAPVDVLPSTLYDILGGIVSARPKF
jgi:hypothetical protein